MAETRLVITGGNGMTGRHLALRAAAEGYRVRALVRRGDGHEDLAAQGVEVMEWDLTDPGTFAEAMADQEIVVHTAAAVGDWGPIEDYRRINVEPLQPLLAAVRKYGRLRRWVQVSSLGVYPAKHHYGTDETTPPNLDGFDGYTRTKAEAEILLRRHIADDRLPVVFLRPGFMYGEGDRHILPRLVEMLRKGRVRIIGDGEQLLDNTYVGNLLDALMIVLDKPGIEGEAFNIRDARLVSRNEFIGTVAEYLGVPFPRRVPLWLAKTAVGPVERISRLVGRRSTPLLTHARMKFLTLNLDYSIDKARRVLGYAPMVDFQEGVRIALDWATSQEKAPETSAAAV